MPTQPIQAQEVRNSLGELLNQVYYQNKQFQIQRKAKPMAWLVSDAFIQAAGQAIDYLIEHKPALADSLTLMLDSEIRAVLEAGTEEMETGERLPLETILTEEAA